VINIEKIHDKVVSVRGASSEMMLFYCFWETSLWPDWMTYHKMTNREDDAVKQHIRVLKAIDAGRPVLLFNEGEVECLEWKSLLIDVSD
jgi:hypothetical protein